MSDDGHPRPERFSCEWRTVMRGIMNDTELIEPRQAIMRRILLRVVFWALGLAACFGAAGIIFAGHETLWRIVGTCAVTALGAFVILGASHMLESEVTWMSGMMTISLTVAEYLAALGLMWNLYGRAENEVGITMVCLAATAIPAIVFSSFLKQPMTSVSGWTGLAASTVVFVLFMVGIWGDWFAGIRDGRWYNLGFSLASFAFLAVLCLVGTGVDNRYWRWLGVAAAAAAFLMSAYAIIRDIHQSSAFFVCVVSVAAVVAHANVMIRCPLKPNHRWLLWGTIGAAIATAAFVDLAHITRPWQEDLLGRLAGAAAIVGGCGTLALLVLARINQRIVPPTTRAADLRQVSLACPRCQAKLSIEIGAGKCENCGLMIEVSVRDGETGGSSAVSR